MPMALGQKNGAQRNTIIKVGLRYGSFIKKYCVALRAGLFWSSSSFSICPNPICPAPHGWHEPGRPALSSAVCWITGAVTLSSAVCWITVRIPKWSLYPARCVGWRDAFQNRALPPAAPAGRWVSSMYWRRTPSF